MRLLGWVGVVSLTSYYFIWKYVFPEDYESLPLRLIGAVACLPAILINKLGKWFEDWITIYWLLALTYVLPFVFGYLLAMNAISAEAVGSSNLIWPLQNVVALFVFILLVNDGFLATLLWLCATVIILAIVLTALPNPNLAELERVYLHPMPLYAFILIVGSLAIRNREVIEYEKLRTMAAVGSTVAHELRTPFLGIRALAEGIQKYLPTLLRSYELAISNGLPVKPIRRAHLEGLKKSLDRINGEIDYSNRIVDMLLINSSESPVRKSEFTLFSASGCVQEALARFPFSSDEERDLIRLDIADDFEVSAPRVLIVHVLFNLIKNGLYYVHRAGRGDISILLRPDAGTNRLIVEDTGTGISAQVINRIFERFFTTTETGHGAGIGLSFCKLVMEGIGGTIHCDSQLGSYTRFTLDFPGVRHG
jgi:two-component system CAI-1 autoinducer sensor kinase/phosphatase CqsS